MTVSMIKLNQSMGHCHTSFISYYSSLINVLLYHSFCAIKKFSRSYRKGDNEDAFYVHHYNVMYYIKKSNNNNNHCTSIIIQIHAIVYNTGQDLNNYRPLKGKGLELLHNHSVSRGDGGPVEV